MSSGKEWAEPFNFSDQDTKILERVIVAHQSITEALIHITRADTESVANIVMNPIMLEFIIKQDATFTKGVTSFMQTGKFNAHTRSLTAVMHKVYTSIVKQQGQKLWRGGRMPTKVGGKWYSKAVEFLVSIVVLRFKGVNVILAEIPHTQPAITVEIDQHQKVFDEMDARIQSMFEKSLLKQSLQVQLDLNNIFQTFVSSKTTRREVR